MSLKIFKIASPCEQFWGDMQGGSKVRHCSLCGHDVNNVCAMSREERNALLEKSAGGERVCVYIAPSMVRRGWYFLSALVFSVVTFTSYKAYMKDKYSDTSGILASVVDEKKFGAFRDQE